MGVGERQVVGERRSAVRTSSGTTSRPAIVVHQRAAARGGRGCGRSGGRRWTGRRPASARGRRTGARVSARRRASSGRVGAGPIAARPSRPVPRSRLMSIVSARSSAVWPVSAPAGSAARRAARARASRFGPVGDARRATSRKATPSGGGEAPAPASASAADAGRSPWSTWIAVTWHPAAAASDERAPSSRRRRRRRSRRRCRRAGTSSGRAASSIDGVRLTPGHGQPSCVAGDGSGTAWP